MAKRLSEVGVDQSNKFRMLALGPLFPEQESFEAHKPYRDQMVTIEYETAAYLRKMNFKALGIHQKETPIRSDVIEEIKPKVLGFLRNETS